MECCKEGRTDSTKEDGLGLSSSLQASCPEAFYKAKFNSLMMDMVTITR